MKIKLNILGALVLVSGLCMAESLTWSQVVTATKVNNLELKMAQEKIQAAKYGVFSAQSKYWPQLSTGISGQQNLKDTDEDPQASFSLSAKQLIYDGFYTSDAIAVAKNNVQQIQNDYLIKETDLRLSLRQYFCELLRSQEQAKLLETILQRRKQQLELVQLRYNAGLEHKGAVLTAQANYAKIQNEVAQLQRQILVNQLRLQNITGLTSLNSVTENIGQNVLESSPDFKMIVNNSYLLQAVLARKVEAKLNINQAYSKYLPEVYASAGYNKDLQKNEKDNYTASAGLGISFSLFDGGSRSSQSKSAESSAKQIDLEIEKTQKELQLTLEEQWNNYLNALDNIKLAEQFLAAKTERSAIASVQYTSGLLTFDNWIIIEDDLINAQKDYLNSKISALLAQAQWIQAKGGILDEK